MRMQMVGLAVAVGTAGAAAPGAEAQMDERPRVTFEARVGYSHPLRDLGRTQTLPDPGPPQGYVAFGTVEPSAVLGAGLTTRLAERVSLRVLGEYGLDTEVRGQWYCEGFSACPAVLQLVDGEVQRWSVGVDLILDLPPSLLGLEPTVFAGVARRATEIRWDQPVSQVPIPTAYDEDKVVFRPGVSVARAVGAFSVFVEADAAIGGSGEGRVPFIEGTVPPDELGEAPTRVDLGLTIGARFRVW